MRKKSCRHFIVKKLYGHGDKWIENNKTEEALLMHKNNENVVYVFEFSGLRNQEICVLQKKSVPVLTPG